LPKLPVLTAKEAEQLLLEAGFNYYVLRGVTIFMERKIKEWYYLFILENRYIQKLLSK